MLECMRGVIGIPYAMIFILFLLLSTLEVLFILSRGAKKTALIILGSIIILISGLRWERGTDWNAYYSFYLGGSIRFYKDWEIGYEFLNNLVRMVAGDNYSVFLIVSAVIVVYFVTKTILRLGSRDNDKSCSTTRSENGSRSYPILALLILWSTSLGLFFPARSSLAYSILFFSLVYIEERKYYRFLVCVAVASSLHLSAVVFLPAYYLFHNFLKRKWHLLMIIMALLSLTVFDKLVILTSRVLGGSFARKAEIYLIESSSSSGTLYGLVNILVLVIVFLFVYRRKLTDDQIIRGEVALFLFGTFLYLGSFFYSPVLYRLSAPYLMVQVILLSDLFSLFTDRISKAIGLLVLFAYLAVSLYFELLTYWDLFIPYKSIFNKGIEVVIY